MEERQSQNGGEVKERKKKIEIPLKSCLKIVIWMMKTGEGKGKCAKLHHISQCEKPKSKSFLPLHFIFLSHSLSSSSVSIYIIWFLVFSSLHVSLSFSHFLFEVNL